MNQDTFKTAATLQHEIDQAKKQRTALMAAQVKQIDISLVLFDRPGALRLGDVALTKDEFVPVVKFLIQQQEEKIAALQAKFDVL